MRILVFPRDPNPYQDLLYGELERLGCRISYLGRITSSHTCNVLLLPLELAVRRAAGARLIHLHWVFGFSFPGAGRLPVLRRLAQAWFRLWLRTARALGMRLVWTAHNVLPHAQVFADDRAARRTLVAASDLVILHSEPTLAELRALGAVPRRSAVIPHGPFSPQQPPGSLPVPGTHSGPRRFLFFGIVQPYKGVEDLLAAAAALPEDLPVQVTIAGHCGDRELRARLAALAGSMGSRVTLRLGRVPEEEVTPLLAAADVVVLPFRRITTSGSALLALSHGRPLIVPDLPALGELPEGAVLRYDRTVPGLAAAMTRLAQADVAALAAMSTAARAGACSGTWQEVAASTLRSMISVLGDLPGPGSQDRACAVP